MYKKERWHKKLEGREKTLYFKRRLLVVEKGD